MKTVVFALALAGAVAVVGCDGGDPADQTPESVAALNHGGTSERPEDDSAAAALGQQIFFDQRLSENGNQACAACHGPQVGWTGPDEDINKLDPCTRAPSPAGSEMQAAELRLRDSRAAVRL